jgi:tripartite-type tricarboxylate transporter receptor subunit TctC
MKKRFAAALAALFTLAVAGAHAQDAWPSKPIRWIVPYAPGGYADIRSRSLARELATILNTDIVVENKAGAGGVLGTDAVAKAPPDGYTIGMGNFAALSVNVNLMKSLPYDPVKDIAPVVLVERTPLILTVGPTFKVTTLKQLIAEARANPGKYGFGSSGVGGAHHLSGEILRQTTGIDIVHVPYKGGSPAAADLMAGHLPMMFELGYSALPSIKAGKITAIAVTSSKRLALLPDVPTMAEAGLPGFESYNWQGVIVPGGTPRAIVDRLNREINAILATPAQRSAIESIASEPMGGTPEAFRDFIASERAKWSKVIKEANIQPQ